MGAMAEKAEKRRRLRDKDLEETKRMVEENITDRLHSQQSHELRLKEMEIAEKKSVREYNLEMKMLELLGNGVSLPGNNDFLATINEWTDSILSTILDSQVDASSWNNSGDSVE